MSTLSHFLLLDKRNRKRMEESPRETSGAGSAQEASEETTMITPTRTRMPRADLDFQTPSPAEYLLQTEAGKVYGEPGTPCCAGE